MTPEQSAQWQEAIRPLDYLDFHALSAEGMIESEPRLANWGVPGWAMQLRAHCIALGWEDHETWVPQFALRSEVALIGLQLWYPVSGERVGVYQRVLLRFFQEVLSPIVAWAQESGDRHSNGYQAVCGVQALCQRLLQAPYPPSPEEYLAWNHALKEAIDPESHNQLDEIISSLNLAILILREWQHIVFFPERWQTWWSRLGQQEVADLTRHLHRLYRMWLKEKGDAIVSHEPIAGAFLTALEAECPLPDWLPGE